MLRVQKNISLEIDLHTCRVSSIKSFGLGFLVGFLFGWFLFGWVLWGCLLFGLRTLISHKICHTLNSFMPLPSPHVAAGLTPFVSVSDSHIMVLLFGLRYSQRRAYLLTAKQQVQTCSNL